MACARPSPWWGCPHCWSSDDQWALPSGDGLTRHHFCSGGAHSPDLITGIEQETKSELSTVRGKAKKQIKGDPTQSGAPEKVFWREALRDE